MANEIRIKLPSGLVLYYTLIRGSDGAVWNGSAFETFQESNWAGYSISLIESGTSGLYLAGFPSNPLVSQGHYDVLVFQQVGGSPLPSDPLRGQTPLVWDGSKEVSLATSGNVESGGTYNYSVLEAIRIMLAALAGKLSGAEGTSITIRDPNDSRDRITAAVDENGNRTSVLLDAD